MSVAPPPPPQPPRRRRRRRRHLLRAGLVGGAGLLGLFLVVRSPWFSDWVARIAESAATELLGEDVVIGGLRLEPGRRRLVVQGLVISHPSDKPEDNGQAIVVAEQVAVDLGLRGWQPIARRITIDRPVVHLHIDDDGLREFRNIRKAPDTGAPEKAPAQAFPWDELWIRGGRFRLSRGDLVVDISELGLAPEGQEGRHRLELGKLRLKVRGWTQEAERISASGIAFTPRGLEVQGLVLDMPVASLKGAGAMAFGGPIHGALSLQARLPELTGLVPEHLRLEGLAGLELRLDGSMGAPELSGDLRLTDTALYRMKEDGEVLLVALQGLDTGLHLLDGKLDLTDLRSDWAAGHVEGAATMDLPSGGFSFELNGEDVSLGQIFVQTGVSDAPWVDLRLDTEIHAGGSVSPFFIAGSADVAARNLRVAGGDVERSPLLLSIRRLSTMLEMRIKDQRMFIAARQVDTGRSKLNAVADLDLSPQRFMDLDLDIESVDLGELRPLVDLDLVGTLTGSGKMRGPFEALKLDAQVEARDLGLLGYKVADRVRSPLLAPNLRVLEFTDLDAMLGETPWRGRMVVDLGATPTDLDMQLLIRDGRLSDLVAIATEVPGLEATVEATVQMGGPVDALDGELHLGLSDIDIFGERFDEGTGLALMRARRITVDHLEISRRGGAEGALARGSIEADGALNLDVHSSAWSLGDLDSLAAVAVQLDGKLSLGAHIGGSLSAPAPQGRLALWDTVLAGRAIGASNLDFETIDQTLSFYGNLGGSELGLAGTLGLGGDVNWALSADLSAFPAHSFYPVAPDGSPIEALVSGQVVASGQLGPVDRPFRLDFQTTEVQLGWDRHQLRSTGPWQLSVGPQRFSLSGVELVGGLTRLSFGGSRQEGGPTMLAGDGVLDLDLLRAVVPGLERSQGLARVELSLSGSRGALEPVVTARIEDGRFHASWLPEPLESVQARLSGRESGYQVQSLTGRMGGGALTGGGRIDGKDWLPTRFDLWAKLVDSRVEYFDWLPAITGDANLAFVGPAEEPLLSGRVDVRDMLFGDRIAWEDAVVDLAGERLTGASAEETADLFSMDIQLVGQRSIRVRNNLGDLVASGDLRLVGDTSRPGLVGDIRAEPGGRVYLKEREFELVRGELHFVEPYAFDPELDIALRTNVQTREDRYLIDYRVAGPWSDWRGESTSDPGLPEADINALLLFGMTRAELERYGGAFSALALEGGDLLASKFGLVETLGQGIYGLEILRPERIDLVSGVTERGAGTVSSELRIIAEKDLDWATIILEQNLSRLSDTYVSLERRLANRLYMRGFWAREQVGRQLNIGGAWGLNVNLRWELD